jgi:ribonuclease HII
MNATDIISILQEIAALQLAAGVDEVGVGPLAGPVISAAVILPASHNINSLKDSKQLSEKQREKLYQEITAIAIDWSIGRAEVEEIDKFNILQATKVSMIRAVEGLKVKPDKVYVDGLRPPLLKYPYQAVIDGDKHIPIISAASIVAKVTRDREMVEMDNLYPWYGFAKNKGYGTAKHLSALSERGFCDIHRKGFSPIKQMALQLGDLNKR